jgi:hypothetical protein
VQAKNILRRGDATAWSVRARIHIGDFPGRRRASFASLEVESSTVIADATVAALSEPTHFLPVESGGAARAARMIAELI